MLHLRFLDATQACVDPLLGNTDETKLLRQDADALEISDDVFLATYGAVMEDVGLSETRTDAALSQEPRRWRFPPPNAARTDVRPVERSDGSDWRPLVGRDHALLA